MYLVKERYCIFFFKIWTKFTIIFYPFCSQLGKEEY